MTPRPIALCIMAAMLGGLVYLNALRNPFVYDDHRTVVDNGSIRTLTDVHEIVMHDATRPLVNVCVRRGQSVRGAPRRSGFT